MSFHLPPVTIKSLYPLEDLPHMAAIIKGQYKSKQHYPATLEVHCPQPVYVRLCLRVNNKRQACNKYIVIKDPITMGARNIYDARNNVECVVVSSGSTKFCFSEHLSTTELYEIVWYIPVPVMTPCGPMWVQKEIDSYYFTYATGNSRQENIAKQYEIMAPGSENPMNDYMEEEFTIDLTE
jgi:hypothetical protein